MTRLVLAAIINSAVGVLVSGIYLAMAIRTLRTHRWTSAILPSITAIAYSVPSASYVLSAVDGRATASINFLGLTLIVLPALVVFQIIRRTRQDEVDVDTIIKGMKDA